MTAASTRRRPSARDGDLRYGMFCLAVIARDHGVSFAAIAADLRRLGADVALDLVEDLRRHQEACR